MQNLLSSVHYPPNLFLLLAKIRSMEFLDKVVLITGSATGFGKLLAETFAQKEASLILSDVNTEGGQAVADAIEEIGRAHV